MNSKDSWQAFLLIDQIIPYLRNPTPAPLSRPPRSAIRQHSLATMMRVNKRAYDRAKFELYTHVVTDQIAKFLHSACIAGVNSPFHLTQTVRFEYRAKSLDFEPTYQSTFTASRKKERWDGWGPAVTGEQKEDLKLCAAECDDLLSVFSQLRKARRTFQVIFPLLQTVIVGSIYGNRNGIWERHEFAHIDNHVSAPVNPVAWQVSLYFHVFIASGNINHLCIWDLYGPLSPGLSYYKHPKNQLIHTTLHFDVSEIPRLILLPGDVTRWLDEGPDAQEFETLVMKLSERFRQTADHPKSLQNSFPNAGRNLHITCSTSKQFPDDIMSLAAGLMNTNTPASSTSSAFPSFQPLCPTQQTEAVAGLQARAREFFDHKAQTTRKGIKSSVIWEASHSGAPCAICASLPRITETMHGAGRLGEKNIGRREEEAEGWGTRLGPGSIGVGKKLGYHQG